MLKRKTVRRGDIVEFKTGYCEEWDPKNPDAIRKELTDFGMVTESSRMKHGTILGCYGVRPNGESIVHVMECRAIVRVVVKREDVANWWKYLG